MWLGRHPAFNYGPKVSAGDSLFAEYRACAAIGLDPEEYFKKDRHMRALITGGYIAESAISSMRQFDIHEENKQKAERERKGRR